MKRNENLKLVDKMIIQRPYSPLKSNSHAVIFKKPNELYYMGSDTIKKYKINSRRL